MGQMNTILKSWKTHLIMNPLNVQSVESESYWVQMASRGVETSTGAKHAQQKRWRKYFVDPSHPADGLKAKADFYVDQRHQSGWTQVY
jgi:hypothetical protein